MAHAGATARRAAAALVAAGWGAVTWFVGCSQVIGVEADRYLAEAGIDAASQDASVDAVDGASDAADASDAPPGWQCIDDPAPPVPDASVQLKFLVNDVSGMQTSGSFLGTPIVGAPLQACARLDFQCMTPIGQATSDDGGIAFMTVPGGFDGFYQVNANAYVPALVVRAPQLYPEYVDIALVSANTLSLGEQLVGVTQDPNDAIAIATIEDCSSNPASGGTVQIAGPAPKEQVVYFNNSLPTLTATSTDQTGAAMIFNVPPGTLTVTGYLPGGRPIRTVAAVARAGWVTYVELRVDQTHVTPP